ncbi:MAG: aminotransferase class V-fold PLP-dependent enzyme [Gammaproteobacteria bacterium]|nr:aminotransferase class V-fold PLP-dependent enzyme [Gammaproteobacteria bacterium]
MNQLSPKSETLDTEAEFWSSVRGDFPLTRDYLHFSQFFMVSHPRQVADAIDRHRQALDHNPFLTVEQGMFGSPEQSQVERIYAAAVNYIGNTEGKIALIPNTTTGLALVYHGLPLSAGDEVLTSTHDHFTQHESIRLATARVGATWRKFNLISDTRRPSLSEILARLRAAIRPETRVLGLTWVYSNTGLRLPVRAITDMIETLNRERPVDRKIITVIDGTHGFGALEDSVADLGCDYFVSSTHKWLFAPRGTGIIYAKDNAWEQLQPVIPTYYTWDLWEAWAAGKPPALPTAPSHISPGGFLAYEHQWAMVEAFEYHKKIGRERIAARIHELNGQLMDRLAAIPGVRLYTPHDPQWSAGIVCFDVDGLTHEEIVHGLLQRRVIASSSPYSTPCARLSAGIMNTPDEVDIAADALCSIARANQKISRCRETVSIQ